MRWPYAVVGLLVVGRVAAGVGGEPATTCKVAELEHRAQGQWKPVRVDLAPARWIWLPSQRTLSNTFVLFRREIRLDAAPRSAKAWITADSRYRLTVNGRRVQWGPAPCDPRQLDVDPADLTPYLRAGKNVIGVEVLFYGLGDGTWAGGKPGLIFHGVVETADGRREPIVSDETWQARLDRAHRPGQPKRWFLRALQEEFDARLHPQDWDTPEARLDDQWVAAQVLQCAATLPAACSNYAGNDTLDRADPSQCALRLRQIPALRENVVPAARLAESGRIEWLRDPADWFEFRMPGAYRVVTEPTARPRPDSGWDLPAAPAPRNGLFATFEFGEQIVGWPQFSIDAPEGTIVELLTQESHVPGSPSWLDTHHFAWSRFICREGLNQFEAFDYESLRWLQLHVRNASRPVIVRSVGVRRRQFAWPHEPKVRCSEPALQRLFDAALNTLRNSAQETCVDGMGRERQQYSGDGGHQLHAIRYAFGETRLPERFLRTFSEGLTPEGYFLDCWPAFDRLARVSQKQISGCYWGPILDHGIEFNFDCWHHWMQTGDRDCLAEPYPRLLKFAKYLASIRGADGLLPVEDLGLPTVWIDHSAYQRQRHRQCAFNLYAAAMFEHALAPIARAFGDTDRAREFTELGRGLLAATVRRFWSPERGLFVNNLPWLAEERSPRLCDRSLATAVLFDQCPGGQTAAAVRALADCPREMGLSYPCNANWRYWALAKAGRGDVIVNDFRRRWATMDSVIQNNTIQEMWRARPDSPAQWSHCALSPIFVLMMDLAGIRPLEPGFTRYQVRPQLGDLGRLELTAYTAIGPLEFRAEPQPTGGHRVRLVVPRGGEGELLLAAGAETDLSPLAADNTVGLKRFRLHAGAANEFFVPSSAPAKSTEGRADLDLSRWIQPVPASAKFADPDYDIWCGSAVRGEDGRYHLYYSRWPRRLSHKAWVTHSEVAHAVSDSPFGPWKHRDVALPARGKDFWDGLCTHNPTVLRTGGKFYLYYMGNTGDGVVVQPLNWTHRNNQRIGVAVADSPDGPWRRLDRPLIDVSPDADAPDALVTTNPAVTLRPDGGVLMIYKAVGKKRPAPFGGPVVHLVATSHSPTGPFKKHLQPIFVKEGVMFPAEDPFVWHDGQGYWAIVKDNSGNFTGQGYSLALFQSADGLDWKPAAHPLVTTPEITWADGRRERLSALERPQLLLEKGRPVALFCAAAEAKDRDGSFNLQIPLALPK